jgi:diguanylate cyclase (GGDEF)-like protein/PAS domain S-box-containing protein
VTWRRVSFETIVECVNDIIVVTEARPIDPPGPRIVYVNAAFERITGYAREEVVGRDPRFLQGRNTSREVRASIRAALSTGTPVRATIVNYTKLGDPYWVELNIVPLRSDSGVITHYVALSRDLTDQKRVQDELYRLATTDPLTGIGNRRSFFDRAAIEVDKARRYARPLSLITLDIDHFKQINDRHGHECGDAVLKGVASRAAGLLRSVDLLGRIGGEEFGIVLPETPFVRGIEVAERLRHEIAALPYPSAMESISVSASFGVSTLDASPADSLEALMRRADHALYQAKASGRNAVRPSASLPLARSGDG